MAWLAILLALVACAISFVAGLHTTIKLLSHGFRAMDFCDTCLAVAERRFMRLDAAKAAKAFFRLRNPPGRCPICGATCTSLDCNRRAGVGWI